MSKFIKTTRHVANIFSYGAPSIIVVGGLGLSVAHEDIGAEVEKSFQSIIPSFKLGASYTPHFERQQRVDLYVDQIQSAIDEARKHYIAPQPDPNPFAYRV